jgi:hypothetical protein
VAAPESDSKLEVEGRGFPVGGDSQLEVIPRWSSLHPGRGGRGALRTASRAFHLSGIRWNVKALRGAVRELMLATYEAR